MRFQGKLSNWNDSKGFGFVEPNGGGERAFVHINSFHQPSRRPVDGDLIIYEVVKQPQGKLSAINVSLVADRKKSSQPAKKKGEKAAKQTGRPSRFLVFSFCIILALSMVLQLLPVEVLFWYLATSTLAFIFYAVDKSAAEKGRWRTPENHLHLLSVIGGWPGAWYAQQKLSHKSSKATFKRVYWLTVSLNIMGFVWLFSEQGQTTLRALLG